MKVCDGILPARAVPGLRRSHAGPGLPRGGQILPPRRRRLPREGPWSLARIVQEGRGARTPHAPWTPPPPPSRRKRAPQRAAPPPRAASACPTRPATRRPAPVSPPSSAVSPTSRPRKPSPPLPRFRRTREAASRRCRLHRVRHRFPPGRWRRARFSRKPGAAPPRNRRLRRRPTPSRRRTRSRKTPQRSRRPLPRYRPKRRALRSQPTRPRRSLAAPALPHAAPSPALTSAETTASAPLAAATPALSARGQVPAPDTATAPIEGTMPTAERGSDTVAVGPSAASPLPSQQAASRGSGNAGPPAPRGTAHGTPADSAADATAPLPRQIPQDTTPNIPREAQPAAAAAASDAPQPVRGSTETVLAEPPSLVSAATEATARDVAAPSTTVALPF